MSSFSPELWSDHSRAVLVLLDSWGVPASEQVLLLGLPTTTRSRSLRRFQEDSSLPNDPTIEERVEHLLGIGEALYTSYPMNSQMGPRWMNTPNYRFDGRTPLAVLMEEGAEGLLMVRCHLDCAYAWQRDNERGGQVG